MSSTMSQHHDVSPLGRGGPHAPAIGCDADATDAVLAHVAAALHSGDPDMIEDAYVALRRAMRSLLHLPDPTP